MQGGSGGKETSDLIGGAKFSCGDTVVAKPERRKRWKAHGFVVNEITTTTNRLYTVGSAVGERMGGGIFRESELSWCRMVLNERSNSRPVWPVIRRP